MFPDEEHSTVNESTASSVPASPPVPASPEITTSFARPDQRTQAMPPSAAPLAPAPPVETDEARDKRLAHELSRRGIPADEVQRLMSLGKVDAAPKPSGKKVNPALISPPELPPSEAFVPKPTITLPDFRESTTQERIEADKLMTAANISRRRGLFKQAEKECLDAINLVPKDATALEMLGDIMQSVGRVDDAAYSYGRAVEADANRKGAEKKYAEIMLLQNKEIELLRTEFIPRNPSVAVLFSAVLPGAGQYYNGEAVKGTLTLAAILACTAAIFWSPYGIPHSKEGIPNSLVVLLLVLSVVYLYAVVDAKIIATRGKRAKSGWEI